MCLPPTCKGRSVRFARIANVGSAAEVVRQFVEVEVRLAAVASGAVLKAWAQSRPLDQRAYSN